MEHVKVLKTDSEGQPRIIEFQGKKYQTYNPENLTINMHNYLHIKANRAAVVNDIKTLFELLEHSLAHGYKDLAKKLHPNLDFMTLVSAIVKTLMDFERINPELYDVLKYDVHPLALLNEGKFPNLEDQMLTEDNIAQALADHLKYARMISMKDLYEALNTSNLSVYKTLGLPQVMSLPYYPALKYQQETKGDLAVGKMFPKTALFYGGSIKAEDMEHVEASGDTTYLYKECPACGNDMHEHNQYMVCNTCHLGLVIVEENESV